MSECPIQSELGAIVIGHSSKEIGVRLGQGLDGSNRFLRSNHEEDRIPHSTGLPEPFQAPLDECQRLPESGIGFVESLGRCPHLGVRLDHFRSHPVLCAEQIEKSNLVLGFSLVHSCAIAEPEGLELPE
jgi:hypothetical protein